MSRSAVHQALASYLSSASIPFVSEVFAYPPKLLPESDFFDVPGTANGAVIFVHLENQRETRIAVGGPTSGKKFRSYGVVLNVVLLSDEPQAETAGENMDALLDGLVSAIEADRTANDPNVVFQWGEGSSLAGGPDIEITAFYPRTRLGTQNGTQVYAECRVGASEILTT